MLYRVNKRKNPRKTTGYGGSKEVLWEDEDGNKYADRGFSIEEYDKILEKKINEFEKRGKTQRCRMPWKKIQIGGMGLTSGRMEKQMYEQMSTPGPASYNTSLSHGIAL